MKFEYWSQHWMQWKKTKEAHGLSTSAGHLSALLEEETEPKNTMPVLRKAEEQNTSEACELGARDTAARALIKMQESCERAEIPRTIMSVRIPHGMYHKQRKLELDLKDLVPNPKILSELFYHREHQQGHKIHPARQEDHLGGRRVSFWGGMGGNTGHQRSVPPLA